MAEVTLEKIHKRIGSAEIIADLSLTVRDGEFFILLGPSGSGKSTLLQIIAGLDQPSGGTIRFDEMDVTRLAPRDRDVAMVFQAYALYPHMTVAENLGFPLHVRRRRMGMTRNEIDGEVRRVAALLGITALLTRYPRQLSGGQRQRVALGRALIRRPRVFLLDEPLSNLDVQLRADMRGELRRLHDELGITTIYVTHDQVEAMTLADRVAVLDRGRLQQVARPRDLYEAPRNLFVAGFIGHPSMNRWQAVVGPGQATADPLRVTVPPELDRRYRGRTIWVGVRPEEIEITAKDEPADATGVVRLVEPTGGQTWVTCEVPLQARPDEPATQTRLVGLAGRTFEGRPGDRVGIRVARHAGHLFDAQTGARLAQSSTSTLIEEAS